MRPNFFHRLRYLLGITSEASWVDRIAYRSPFDKAGPPTTIREIHAVLSDAIEKGHGEQPVFIQLESIEGQLCGIPQAHVSSLVTDFTQIRGTQGYCAMVPHMSLVHVAQGTFKELKKLESALGPYT